MPDPMTTTDPKLIEPDLIVELRKASSFWINDREAERLLAVIERHTAAAIDEAAQKDKDRLDYLMRESHDLRCFPVPTGGDDADIGWRVVGHFMAEPQERTIAEVFRDDPRAAIDAAIEAKESQHGDA